MKIILKETLKNRNVSQYQLAKETGIAASTLNKICNGKTTSIDFDILQKICDTIQCDVSDIMQPDPTNTKDDTK